ncbi:MAG: NAD(P)/FAD-dependent oxidoreductase [Bacteroidota bacterium]|nr:NAD(P)/FAD-dependent oxidoreductase [Bacteroidota bacterium]
MNNRVAIIGGGAAGFFAAISCKMHAPNARVVLYEKSVKLLAKVKVSGGGRCNVTNGCQGISTFAAHYPRGEKHLKKAFSQFNASDTIEWFESRGVQLKEEADGRVFPVTDDSQTIVDCLLNEARKLRIDIQLSAAVQAIQKEGNAFKLRFKEGTEQFDRVIVATGGSPKPEGFGWLESLGHQVESPVPSLFTFNMPGQSITQLMGVSVPAAVVKIQGTRLMEKGPLLITHWGMSGPAILKTSAWGARLLHEMNYKFIAHINWLGLSETELREMLGQIQTDHPKKKIKNQMPLGLTQRLWEHFLTTLGIDEDKPWAELSKKSLNRLVEKLGNDQYPVNGKTTFKEEFVTAGGVKLGEVNFNTMESRVVEGLFFAGEVLDIDGITGGFNFQAAWTTGYIAGKHCLA